MNENNTVKSEEHQEFLDFISRRGDDFMTKRELNERKYFADARQEDYKHEQFIELNKTSGKIVAYDRLVNDEDIHMLEVLLSMNNLLVDEILTDGLEDILKEVKNGDVKLLIVRSLDRISRDAEQVEDIIETLAHNNVRLVEFRNDKVHMTI